MERSDRRIALGVIRSKRSLSVYGIFRIRERSRVACPMRIGRNRPFAIAILRSRNKTIRGDPRGSAGIVTRMTGRYRVIAFPIRNVSPGTRATIERWPAERAQRRGVQSAMHRE